MFFAREEISFPADLESALNAGLWKNAPSSDQLQKQASALSRLWEKLAKRRGMAVEGETHYAFQRPEAEAYAAYYLPANALKTALVLEEAFLLGIDILGAKSTWLDFGTGPGTAYWGLAWWSQQRKKNLQFTGWDQSPVFAELAARLAKSSPFPARADFFAGGKEDAPALARRIQPTHVSFVNSIAEIYPAPAKRLEACRKILRTLQDASTKDGRARYLIIIEPGSRESSRELAALKDELQSDTVSSTAILPCLDSRKCGALAKPSDWCHEEVACRFPTWLNELGATAGMRKESVIFSYVVLQVGARTEIGGARVVSQRLERKGQVECWVCTKEGKQFARAQRSKAGPGSVPVIEACRGDIWQEMKLAEKGDLENARLLAPVESSIFLPA